jgi:hypothetical protein
LNAQGRSTTTRRKSAANGTGLRCINRVHRHRSARRHVTAAR